MHTRHTNELMLRLERVADIGVAEIRRHELMKWFDKDRLTVNVWSEINDKWAEVLAAENYSEAEIKETPLFIGESDGVFVLVFGAKLIFDPTDRSGTGLDPWLYPMSEWMKVKERKPRASKSSTTTEDE